MAGAGDDYRRLINGLDDTNQAVDKLAVSLNVSRYFSAFYIYVEKRARNHEIAHLTVFEFRARFQNRHHNRSRNLCWGAVASLAIFEAP